MIASLLLGMGLQTALATESWATKQAASMTRLAEQKIATGEVEPGIAKLLQAIQMDATYGPAYLALADIRVRQGELGQALAAYDAALEHIPSLHEAYTGRAGLRERAGQIEGALSDLRRAERLSPEDPEVLLELERLLISARKLPEALAVARRRQSAARRRGDVLAEKAARTTGLALAHLVGSADPVGASSDRGWVRRAIAKMHR